MDGEQGTGMEEGVGEKGDWSGHGQEGRKSRGRKSRKAVIDEWCMAERIPKGKKCGPRMGRGSQDWSERG